MECRISKTFCLSVKSDPLRITSRRVVMWRSSPKNEFTMHRQKQDLCTTSPILLVQLIFYVLAKPNLVNVQFLSGGGNVKIQSVKLDFKEKAKPKIDAKSEYVPPIPEKKVYLTMLLHVRHKKTRHSVFLPSPLKARAMKSVFDLFKPIPGVKTSRFLGR